MATATELPNLELGNRHFEQICGILYDVCGIKLGAGKEGLVKSRLQKRLRNLGFDDFETYVDFVQSENGAEELATMVDALTTNKTSFFREPAHFEFLQKKILPNIQGQLRIWSAGCSSGEEPYSIAIMLHEELSGIDRMDVRVLATDISVRMLTKAREGVYSQDCLEGIPKATIHRFFTKVRTHSGFSYRVNDQARALIRFAPLNLMESWPMRGPFDVVFCRNVMIYFDKPTREQLVNRYWELLKPGGHLFVGHSESLTGSAHRFRYVQPAVYVK
jgi:chemotaxis protein methyltransferase CheR